MGRADAVVKVLDSLLAPLYVSYLQPEKIPGAVETAVSTLREPVSGALSLEGLQSA